MENCVIRFSLESKLDIMELYDYIAYQLRVPETAVQYVKELYDKIGKLSYYGASIAPNPREYLQKRYGPGAKTVVYKKMTIVFNVIDKVILIRRVLPGSSVL